MILTRGSAIRSFLWTSLLAEREGLSLRLLLVEKGGLRAKGSVMEIRLMRCFPSLQE